jgi:hypothetical protein
MLGELKEMRNVSVFVRERGREREKRKDMI